MMRSTITRFSMSVGKSSFVRFLISGGINTGATYAGYLVLLNFTGYKLAYSIAYIFGIALAFMVNRFFVFRTHRGWQSIMLFPFVYLAQYLASLAIVWICVDQLSLKKEVAPLIAVTITIPLTFMLSRFVFGCSPEDNPHRN